MKRDQIMPWLLIVPHHAAIISHNESELIQQSAGSQWVCIISDNCNHHHGRLSRGGEWDQFPVSAVSAAAEAELQPVQPGRAHHGRALPPHLPRAEHRRGVAGWGRYCKQLGQVKRLFVYFTTRFLCQFNLCQNMRKLFL